MGQETAPEAIDGAGNSSRGDTRGRKEHRERQLGQETRTEATAGYERAPETLARVKQHQR